MQVSLRAKPFKALAPLLEHSGEVVTREELQPHLWRESVFVDFDNNLNAAIAHLRVALADSAEHPRFIETLPRHGYRFLARVSETSHLVAPSPAPRFRLLVLPFVNLSGNPSEEFFSDAMTNEVITTLANLAGDDAAVWPAPGPGA